MVFEMQNLDEMIEATRQEMYSSVPGSEERAQLSEELDRLMKIKVEEFKAVGAEYNAEEDRRVEEEKQAESKRQRIFTVIVEGLKTVGIIAAAVIPALIMAGNRDKQVDKILDYEGDEDSGGIITSKAFNEAMKDR